MITDPIAITHAEAAAGACCARQASKCLRPARRGRLWLAGNHASARLSHKCQLPFQTLALCELTAWQLMIALLPSHACTRLAVSASPTLLSEEPEG